MTPTAALEEPPVGQVSFLRSLLLRPAAAVAALFLILLVLACLVAPLLAPYDPRAQDLNNVLSGPTAQHWLGTDTLGRDVLSRLLYGGRRSMLSVAEAVVSVLLLSVPFGLAAGYAGGWLDKAFLRVADIFMAVPAIILVLVTLAVVPRNENAAMLVLGILGAPGVLRVVRSATAAVRGDLYIAAARVSGVSHVRIVVRHVLPRVKGPIIVQATLFAAAALLFETGLGYLGLATDPLTPSWGGMVADAASVITRQKWLLYPTGATIALTILALGILGDAIRDAAGAASGGDGPPARRNATATSPGPMPSGQGRPAGAAGTTQLAVAGLSVGLSSGELLVEDVNFTIGQAETVGLLGESGCGKSITALAVLRLLPSAASVVAGQVWFGDRELTGLSGREFDGLRGSGIGYVSQEPLSSLDPVFTVGAQLAEVVRHHDGGSRKAVRARVQELLAQVRIAEPDVVAGKYPHELSGGMAQRAAIALALAGRPRVLIADEPTTALDVTLQSQILQLLRDLQRTTEMSMLLVTHDWGVVADICDRAVVMYAGQTVEAASTDDLFGQPLHPYSRGLLESNPAMADDQDRLPSLPGRVPSPGHWPLGCRFAPRCPLAVQSCVAAPVAVQNLNGGRTSRCIRVDALCHDKEPAWSHQISC